MTVAVRLCAIFESVRFQEAPRVAKGARAVALRRSHHQGDQGRAIAFLAQSLALDTDIISEENFRSLVTQTIRVRKMLYALLKVLGGNQPTPATSQRASNTASPQPPAGPPSALGR
jgi:hypothetical protein